MRTEHDKEIFEDLRGAADRIDELEAALARAKHSRDQLIVDMALAGFDRGAVAAAARISPHRIRLLLRDSRTLIV